MNAIIFVPFAFGGNPATESGPKAIFQYINKSEYKHTDFIVFRQSIDISAEKYLLKCEKKIFKVLKEYDKCCVVGGNHLSILPLYNAITFRNSNASIITMDAHRDYYPENDLNHATFLSHIKGNDYRIHLIGSRDYENHNQKKDCINLLSYKQFLDFKEIIHTVDLLDIDVDVFDDKWFPYYCTYLPKGLSYDDVLNIIDFSILKKCKCMSISEYMPYYDNQLNGASIINMLIKRFFCIKEEK